MVDNNPSRVVARFIQNTIKRGPRPHEVVLYKKWQGEARRRAEQEAAWAALEVDYRHGVA